MSKEIPLTQGKIARVCDCHYQLVAGYKWSAARDTRNGKFRAERKATLEEQARGSPTLILMHAVINGTPKGFPTDHVDGDTLNNQCSNLRTATARQNSRNRGKQKDNTSGYKGVSRYKHYNRWRATINDGTKWRHLGYFPSPEAAAHAYDHAAVRYHGEFARLNFPKEEQ